MFQRLFAPFLPFVSEEVWSWWQQGSVHRASWPEIGDLDREGSPDRREAEREDMALDVTADVLREVRKAKSEAREPMRAPVARVIVHDSAERLAALRLGEGDLLLAGAIERIEPLEAPVFAVEVELATEDAA